MAKAPPTPVLFALVLFFFSFKETCGLEASENIEKTEFRRVFVLQSKNQNLVNFHVFSNEASKFTNNNNCF